MKETLSSTGVKAGTAAPGVEHAAGERNQRHEENVGEGDACQGDGQGELLGVVGKARRGDIDEQRGSGHAEQGHRQHDQEQEAHHPVHQLPGFIGTAPVPVFPENRNKGLRESAFRKQAAEQVGQPESNEKGVGQQSGAEGARDHEVADEPENTRQQGHAADGGEGLQEVHCGSGRRPAGAKPDIIAPEHGGRQNAGSAASESSGWRADPGRHYWAGLASLLIVMPRCCSAFTTACAFLLPALASFCVPLASASSCARIFWAF